MQAKQKALGFTDEEIERQSTFPYKRVGSTPTLINPPQPSSSLLNPPKP
jgi:hypothetical protein